MRYPDAHPSESIHTGNPFSGLQPNPIITVGSTDHPGAGDANDLQIVTGQTIYVPAYTEIFFQNATRTFQLTVTLAIHNTDPEHPIIIQSVRFYDTDGTQITDYVEEPLRLDPLATTGFVVESSPDNGGWGANFIVEWGAETPVYEPVVEAVMIGTQGSQGISLISPGRILSQTHTSTATE